MDEKELKRRQFEEAMAREREGKDDGFSEGKWK